MIPNTTLDARPNLIDSNVKYFIGATLNNCHQFKDKYFNGIFNIGLFIGFVIILGIILIMKYKGNKNTKDIADIERKNREFIIYKLLKIKQENQDDRRMRNGLITNLPTYGESVPRNR